MRPHNLIFAPALSLLFFLTGCQAPDSKLKPTAESTQPANAATRTPEKIPPRMKHKLIRSDLSMLKRGELAGTCFAVEPDSIAIMLDQMSQKKFPITGQWTSEMVFTDFEFTELLPSWNASVPEQAGIRFDVRVLEKGKSKLSPWLYVGQWGEPSSEKKLTQSPGMKVAIDILELQKPATAFQIRATLLSFDPAGVKTASLRNVSAVYSANLRAGESQLTTAKNPPATRPARVDLAVPFRAQGVEPPTVSHSLCSPTSTSMVMAFAGVNTPTLSNALAIYDKENGIFGNWNRAVQFAGSSGLDAHLTRFESVTQAMDVIASGQPIIASINFSQGQFPSNVMKSTDGHLIVLRGYDDQGNFIVNDPASKTKGDGILYRASELDVAWIRNTGGVAYIIRK